ncbi:7-deoxyloganetin glucosyltransferase [Handroanthus impetiginosus]|uniref:7-deoxyloganetin glucosyltransferase n=1 Tax=Handroanthus impetiginosus TaxID=429701 RepID=A0A2G9GIF0_9LAMI|nr:7-deoxyloganetin glucosyltransferase [Handroanthus impetiginosus]
MAYCHYGELKNRGIFPLHDESQITIGYLETELNLVPGMKNIRLRDFPSFIQTTDPDDIMVNHNILQTKNACRAKAVIIHTFDDLEKEVPDAIRQKFDHVFTISPLQLLEHQVENLEVNSIGSNLWKEDNACIAWLNQRAPNTVLYVNFGSIIVLSPQQLLEFAWGLANSNQYFLWIIRPDLVRGESAILPQEYLKEVEGRAMMAGWCSQEQGISEGVQMICWPFFVEQQTNCRYACMDWEIGLQIEGNVERGKVVELVKVLMEGEKGKDMRKKALEWKDKAQLAGKPGGSSYHNLEFLINDMLLKNY